MVVCLVMYYVYVVLVMVVGGVECGQCDVVDFVFVVIVQVWVQVLGVFGDVFGVVVVLLVFGYDVD